MQFTLICMCLCHSSVELGSIQSGMQAVQFARSVPGMPVLHEKIGSDSCALSLVGTPVQGHDVPLHSLLAVAIFTLNCILH